MSPKLFNQRQAADYLTDNGHRCDPAELSKMGKYGAGPKYQRVGQQKIFTKTELDRWLAEQNDASDDQDGEAPRPA